MTKTYFITGAEGVGKSSIIHILKKHFPKIDIHDFDEVGVPLNPKLQWRLNTTLHWIKKAKQNQENNKSTCIVGLCFPNEVKDIKESKKIYKIFFCLLDLHESERERRLHKRNSPKEQIQDLEQLHQLRDKIKKTKYSKQIIDTTKLSIEEAAKKVIEWIKRKGE